MRTSEMREMTDEEIDVRVRELQDELFQLRMRSTYEELENPLRIRGLRREIARLRTIRRERELADRTTED